MRNDQMLLIVFFLRQTNMELCPRFDSCAAKRVMMNQSMLTGSHLTWAASGLVKLTTKHADWLQRLAHRMKHDLYGQNSLWPKWFEIRLKSTLSQVSHSPCTQTLQIFYGWLHIENVCQVRGSGADWAGSSADSSCEPPLYPPDQFSHNMHQVSPTI